MEVRWMGPRGGPCEGLAKWVTPSFPFPLPIRLVLSLARSVNAVSGVCMCDGRASLCSPSCARR